MNGSTDDAEGRRHEREAAGDALEARAAAGAPDAQHVLGGEPDEHPALLHAIARHAIHYGTQLNSTLIQVSSRAEARGRPSGWGGLRLTARRRWSRDGWGGRNGTGRGATARGGTCAAPTERTLSARKAVQPADLCAAARITRVYSTVE